MKTPMTRSLTWKDWIQEAVRADDLAALNGIVNTFRFGHARLNYQGIQELFQRCGVGPDDFELLMQRLDDRDWSDD